VILVGVGTLEAVASGVSTLRRFRSFEVFLGDIFFARMFGDLRSGNG
jgi:hypothetical protein